MPLRRQAGLTRSPPAVTSRREGWPHQVTGGRCRPVPPRPAASTSSPSPPTRRRATAPAIASPTTNSTRLTPRTGSSQPTATATSTMANVTGWGRARRVPRRTGAVEPQRAAAGRAALPPHAVAPEDHAQQTEGGRGQCELADQAEQVAHVGEDADAGQLGQHREVLPQDRLGHRARVRVEGDLVALHRPVAGDLGDGERRAGLGRDGDLERALQPGGRGRGPARPATRDQRARPAPAPARRPASASTASPRRRRRRSGRRRRSTRSGRWR